MNNVGVGIGFRLKKSLELSMRGVIGVAGDDMSIDESSLPLRKPRSMVEKSELSPELTELPDDVPETERPGMSGAVKA